MKKINLFPIFTLVTIRIAERSRKANNLMINLNRKTKGKLRNLKILLIIPILYPPSLDKACYKLSAKRRNVTTQCWGNERIISSLTGPS